MAFDDELGGRPPKEGIDWFPLQTNLDTKFAFVQSEVRQDYKDKNRPFIYASAARDIILRMYQQVYDEKGWYYPWDEDHIFLFIDKENLGMDFTTYAMNLALKRGIFHRDIYKEYEILTSKGLQERYLNATYKRKKVVLYKELILTEEIDRDNITIKSVSDVQNQADIKFTIDEVADKNEQSKPQSPKRTKVKEITQKLVELWNDKNDTRLRFLDSRVREVERRLRTFTPKELQQAIMNRASDPWIAENNQQSNWDALFRKDKAIDEWLNRTPKNGHKKNVNPKASDKWLPIEEGKLHAEHHRKELKPAFYDRLEYEGRQYVKPKFTNDISVPQMQN